MNDLIESHLGYAHAIAASLIGKYPPSITRADLEGAAEYGLVQAAHSYDPAKRVTFATFAFYRVRGAIFDEVRRSWRASHLREESDRGTSPRVEGADSPESSFAPWELEDSTSSNGGSFPICFDIGGVEQLASAIESPANQVLRKEESLTIRAAIGKLPKRHRVVVEAHYYDDLSLVSIGRQLNLSKSWVSRIHSQALVMLRRFLVESQEPSVT